MKKTILLNLLFWSMYAMGQIPFQDHVLHQNPADGLLNPNYATFTDIDGDGDMDVLGCTWYGKKFYWYENTDGQGMYGQQNIILQQYQASVLQPADIDGDGDTDFVAAVAYPQSKIIWFENTDGQGSFGPEQFITSDVDYPRNLHVADIDNDGDLDLLSASLYDDKLAWYENDGTGNFGQQQIISIDLDFVYNVTTADIDGDGDLDVLSSTSSYSDPKVVWYENTDGQGTFGTANLIAAKRSRNVKTSDFDGDGDIDVVFGYFSGGVDNDKLFYYENTDGTGSTWNEHIVDDIGGPYYIRVEDLNNDGNLDVVATDLNDTYWYSSDGNGNFGSRIDIYTNQFDWHIETGDINNDGYPEVITSLSSVGEERIFVNNNGNFNQSFVINQPSSSAVINKAADMDGDGDMDMVAVLSGKNSMYYYRNDGQNNFQEISIDVSNIGIDNGNSNIKLVDTNNDGYLDIVLNNGGETRIYIYDGNNTYTEITPLYYTGFQSSVDVSDVIPSGYKEIIAFEWGMILIYSTNDGMNYTLQNSISLQNFSYDIYSKLSTKDIDGDGLIDIIVATQPNTKNLSWYKNLGNGSFGNEQIILSNANVKNFKPVDMDSDSDTDILVDYIDYNAAQRKIVQLTNISSGTFSEQVLQDINPMNYYNNEIDYADLDNDGDNDIIYSTNTDIVYLENDGTGNYLAPQNVYPIDYSFSVQVVDVNNDNKNDIVSTSTYEGKVFWLENTLGTGDISESHINKFNIYPNPFTDTITIEATDTSNIINVSIQNMQAQIVYKGDYTGQINLKNLPSGMYLLNIEGQHGNKAVFKLIKK